MRPAASEAGMSVKIGSSAGMPMTFFTLIHQYSMPNENCGTGSKTMPAVQLVDVSGLRSGLPPSLVVNCALQSRKLPVDGQRAGSGQLPPVGPKRGGCARAIDEGG